MQSTPLKASLLIPAEVVVQQQLDAYNAQDIEAFLACWHPDCEFVRWGGEVDLRGHAAFREAYTQLWRRSPRLQARILNRIVVGRHVIDLEHMLDHADGPREPLVVIYETEAERIRRVHLLKHDT
jgi:hypothetical protein